MKAESHTHRETKATAPVLDSTRFYTGNRDDAGLASVIALLENNRKSLNVHIGSTFHA